MGEWACEPPPQQSGPYALPSYLEIMELMDCPAEPAALLVSRAANQYQPCAFLFSRSTHNMHPPGTRHPCGQ